MTSIFKIIDSAIINSKYHIQYTIYNSMNIVPILTVSYTIKIKLGGGGGTHKRTNHLANVKSPQFKS